MNCTHTQQTNACCMATHTMTIDNNPQMDRKLLSALCFLVPRFSAVFHASVNLIL